MAKTRKTTKPTPPRTAWDLCERVAQHIEEEPLRYYQRSWWLRGRDLETLVNWHTIPAKPSCGTTACRAGWIVELYDGKRGARSLRNLIGDRAREILGVSADATKELFAGDGASGSPGTAEYAASGADGLRTWMRRRSARLKSRLLKNVPKLDREKLRER